MGDFCYNLILYIIIIIVGTWLLQMHAGVVVRGIILTGIALRGLLPMLSEKKETVAYGSNGEDGPECSDGSNCLTYLFHFSDFFLFVGNSTGFTACTLILLSIFPL